MADGLLRTSGGFGLLEAPTEDERRRMMGSALGNAAMMVAQANQRGGMGLGGLLGMAGGGFAQGMRQAEQDFRQQQLEDFQIQQQQIAAEQAARQQAAQRAFAERAPEAQRALAEAYPEIYGKEAAKAAFAEPEGLSFGTSYKGNALEIYNALVEKPNRTAEENRMLNQAQQILSQPSTMVTPQGTYIQPGLSLGGGAPAAAAQTPMGQQVAGQPVQPGVPGQQPGFVPKAVSGEQAMRTAMVPGTMKAINRIEELAKSDEYLEAYAQVKAGEAGLYPTWAMTRPGRDLEFSLNFARENIMRALTGAAAPQEDVERAGWLLTPPPMASNEEIEWRMQELRDMMGRYFELSAPGRGGVSTAGPQATTQQPAQGIQALNIGAVRKGYRYKGGDPSQQNSWEKVP